MIQLLKTSFGEWIEDDCPSMAAALSYYTVFSLPPLLLLVLMVVGLVVDPSVVEGRISSEIAAAMGPEAADQIRGMIEDVSRPGSSGPLMAVLGIAGLLFGATSALAQLQRALNRAWEVEPDPNRAGWKIMLRKRVFSLGMILTLAFIMLVSLLLTAVLNSFGDTVAGWLPGGLSGVFLQSLTIGVSLAVATLLFAAIFRFLPDAKVAWRDVWVGALSTAILFETGKFLLGFWISRSNPGEAFGAAGALALILVWIYVSSMILLFGAELTHAWAVEHGSGIEPEDGAVRVVREKRHIGASGATAREAGG